MLAWSLARHVRSPLVRAFWLSWPLIIAFITIITGNHFIIDVVLGVATAGVSAVVAHRLAAIRPVWGLQPSRSPVATT
jgi:membrane-associated phospholipid phosphatase